MTTQFLALAQGVMDELGLDRPISLVGSADPNARRLVALLDATGQALYRAHDWSVLAREYPFTTSAGVDNYAIPEDWGRGVGSTAWDRTTFWSMRGNLTPGQWQVLRSSFAVSPAMRFGYRAIVGPRQAAFMLDPVPTGEHDLVIEYVSRWWAEQSDGDGQEGFVADADHTRLDDELFRLGLMWRVRKGYGFPYADDRADYEAQLRSAKISDLNMPAVQLGRPSPRPLANVADGNWAGEV